MVGIQIGNEFLDLPPGTVMEIENANPFLQFNNEITGAFSLPFQVPATEKNLRLLQYAAIAQKKVTGNAIDAIVYDNSLQLGIGKVKIEKANINLNKIRKGVISCYFLQGSSNFFQDIKGKKIREINVGGNRVFNWDNYAAAGPGFSGHITTVLNGAAGYGASGYDYCFYPVINKAWPGVLLDPDCMNWCFLDGGIVKFGSDQVFYNGRNPNRYVPFPYLKYVLIKIFEYVGWELKGNILDDTYFKKITLINFRGIDWCYVKKSGGNHQLVPHNIISFNLKDHLPDIDISAFLIAIKNRLGLWYDFDYYSKKATIKKVIESTSGSPADMTDKASPLLSKNILQERKIYALRNMFATDLGDGAPNFSLVDREADVNQINNLPAATEAQTGQCRLVVAENNFYICRQNETTEAYQWEFFAYNIFDYEPAGFNDEITTEATTVGVEVYNNYLDLIPRIDNQGERKGLVDDPESSWGIHLCFYHGHRDNKNGDPYPYASSHVYDSNMVQVADWALAFECKKTDGSDVGLYELNWKPLLDILGSQEEFEATLRLNYIDYLALKFSHKINIAGIDLFIKQVKSSIPFSGSVSVSVVRL